MVTGSEIQAFMTFSLKSAFFTHKKNRVPTPPGKFGKVLGFLMKISLVLETPAIC